jgi:two-component system, LytTR family, response regulator
VTVPRTVIVDDEVPACELLQALLAAWPTVEIVGEAHDGETALALIRGHRPDAVFLDIQMPDMSAFDVVARLSLDAPPIVVFVTAHDQYALRAFEISACDYLLKPLDADRLAMTMTRVLDRHQHSGDDVGSALRALLAQLQQPAPEQIVVKVDGRHLFLANEEVEWIEALGKVVRIHYNASVIAVQEPLGSIEHRLPPSRFVRVHRSVIVNRQHIREMQPWFKGRHVLILRSGTRIVTGRSYQNQVRHLIG